MSSREDRLDTTSEHGIHASADEHGLVTIEIDVPGKSVNLISPPLLEELSQAIDSIRTDSRIRGVLFVSRKPDHFIGGAEIDVGQFMKEKDATLDFVQRGRDVFQKIAELPVPTVAAIHGACLGGGLELALTCQYRLASEHAKTRMGLPEVMLGILPAWGGTTRLPRLVGLSASLELLLTGKQLNARRAEKMGLIDRVTTPKEIKVQAASFIEEILSGGETVRRKVLSARDRSRRGIVSRFLDRNLAGRAVVFRQARKNVLKLTRGHYPAPLKIIDIVRKGIDSPLQRALDLEQQGIKDLVNEEVTYNLLHVFSLRMHSGGPTKDVKVSRTVSSTEPETSPGSGSSPAGRLDRISPVHKVGVIGAGIMGAGIAQWLLQQGLRVRLRDINEEAVSKGIKSIYDAFNALVSRRRLRPAEKEDRMRLLSGTTGYSGFSGCDLVIEAVAERMEIKHRVIRELQEAAGDRAIFATNTSSLSVTAMAEAAKHPERVLGLHFFNPVSRMPLVEVVRGSQTSDETVTAGMAFVKQIGKTPLIVSDSPGFLVNRILMAYGNEAGLLLEEGSSVEEVDRAMETFGMPMGPFTMMDIVGLDIAYHTAESIRHALQLDPAQQSGIGDRLFAAGLLGKKNGRGFYRYEKGKKIENAGLEAPLAAIRKDRGLYPRSDITRMEITERLLLIMVNTASWCLERKIIQGAGDVDLGMIMGAGFPPFRGGLLKYCDKLGIAWVKDKLDRYAQISGKRFEAAMTVRIAAERNTGFYHTDR
jgi:3-hydroxyacyl-CoA dehydrogenase / enoyl-CoA hydratase / 3-hydroxybutyryl-CoA epimerase